MSNTFGDAAREHVLGTLRTRDHEGKVAPLGAGDFCTAWTLDGHLVVRLPRHERAVRALEREARLLDRLHGRLPLPLPGSTWHPGPRPDAPGFAVHELLPGAPLTRALWRSLPEPARTRFPARLGAFLRALHEVDVGVGEAAGLERVDHEARVRARVADADGRMRALPDTLGRALREAFAGWVAENAVRPYRPAILHADLSPEHVLVDPAAGAITGIIDWGDAVVGDPARDFIFLYEDWDLDFLDHAIAGYAPGLAAEAWARLRARVLVHYLADQLDWTLTAHAEGRASDVRHGVDGLERALSALRDRA